MKEKLFSSLLGPGQSDEVQEMRSSVVHQDDVGDSGVLGIHDPLGIDSFRTFDLRQRKLLHGYLKLVVTTRDELGRVFLEVCPHFVLSNPWTEDIILLGFTG